MSQPVISPLRVSVIMATYNRRDVLAECLATYADQTHPDVEIVVVDNGSSDGTVAHVREHFPHVVIMENTGTNGPEALNLAAQHATGGFLWRTDDDAYPDSPDTLKDAVNFMTAFPHVTVVTGDILERLIDYQPLDYYPYPRPEALPAEGLAYNEFWGAAAMIRRQAFLEAGGFWDVFYLEELDLSSRLIMNGGQIRYAPWIRVRHLSAFAKAPDIQARWLLRAETTARYQFAYFPLFRACARTVVVWLGQMVAAIGHGLSFSAYLTCIRVMFRGMKRGRSEHRVLTRAELRQITFGRSIWSTVFLYYWMRWKHRRSST